MKSIQPNVTGRAAPSFSTKVAPPDGAWAYHVSQFCELAQIGKSTFWKYVREGKINVVRVAGRTLVTDAEKRRLFDEAA